MPPVQPGDNPEADLPVAMPDDDGLSGPTWKAPGSGSSGPPVPTVGTDRTGSGSANDATPTVASAPARKRRRPEPEPGETVGEYRLIGELGRGGMGVVFEAAHPRLTKPVALKILPPEFAEDPEAVRRFLLEGRTASRIDDDHVVRVLDIGEAAGVHYMAMELVRGGNAKEFIEARGAMNWPEATRVIAAACRGLAAVHRAGLVHRDVKPANIMRSADGQVKLADFGLAKSNERSHTSITAAGTVVGTPHYMSPEQCRADRLDARSDVYSLGATYFALLAGRSPFATAGAPLNVMFAHCNQPVPDPREVAASADTDRGVRGLGGESTAVNATIAAIPDLAVDVVFKAMAKDPAGRFGSAEEMLAALEAVLSGGSMPASVAGNAWDDLAAAVASSRLGRPGTISGQTITRTAGNPSVQQHSPHAPSHPPARTRKGPPVALLAGIAAALVIGVTAAFVLKSPARPVTPGPVVNGGTGSTDHPPDQGDPPDTHDPGPPGGTKDVTKDTPPSTKTDPGTTAGAAWDKRGLVGHWTFDETEPGRVFDTSGFGRHGTVSSAERVAGVSGGALRFGADRTSFVHVPDLRLTGAAFTLSVWARHDRVDGGIQTYVRLLDGGKDEVWLRMMGDKLTFNCVGSIPAPLPADPSQWHHIAGTWDGRVQRFYVDGVLVKEAWLNQAVVPSISGLHISRVGEQMKGDLDDVRVYDRALSADEVAALYRKQEAGQPVAGGGWKTLFDPAAPDDWEKLTTPENVTTVTEGELSVLKLKARSGIVTKEQFGDYHLTLEFRHPDDKTRADLGFRTAHRPFFNVDLGRNIAGKLLAAEGCTIRSADVRAGAIAAKPHGGPAKEVGHSPVTLKTAPEWNTLELVVIGDAVLVAINGKWTCVGAEMRISGDGKVPTAAIRLYVHDGSLDIANVRIRPITVLPEKFGGPKEPVVPPVVSGRYVRVSLHGGQRILSLAEVEVFSGGVNVARKGKATQSSLAEGGVPERAIDGNTNGNFGRGEATHTLAQPNPWWEVDLGAEVPIETVVVWNRTDGGGEVTGRLNSFQLMVLDANHKLVFITMRNPAPTISARFEFGGPPGTWRPLFNGLNLGGWTGNRDRWMVGDVQLKPSSGDTPEILKAAGEFGDFTLKAKVWLGGNSGIRLNSASGGGTLNIEIDSGDTRPPGRSLGRFDTSDKKVRLPLETAHHKGGVWNDLEVVRRGTSVRFLVNGKLYNEAGPNELPELARLTGSVSIGLEAYQGNIAFGEIHIREDSGVPARPVPVTGEASRIIGHAAGVPGVAISADGKTVISGSHDGTARAFSLATGKETARFTHGQWVWAVAALPDGKRAVSVSQDRTARVWNIETGQELAVFSGHTGTVTCVALLPDGKHAVTAGWDNILRVWELDTGKQVRASAPLVSNFWSVAVSPDGTRALTGAQDSTVRLWDLTNCKVLALLQGHTDVVGGVAFSAEGKRALTASTDGTIRLWDLEKAVAEKVLIGHANAVHKVVFLPGGKHALSAGEDGTLRLWSLDEGRELHRFTGHVGRAWGLALSKDGATAVSGGEDRTIRTWKLPAEVAVPGMAAGPARPPPLSTWGDISVRQIDVSADGLLMVAARVDGRASVNHSAGGKTKHSWVTAGRCFGAAFSKDGQSVLTLTEKGTITRWSLAGQPLATATPEGVEGASGLAVSPKDGTLAVAWGRTGWNGVGLFEPSGLKRIALLEGYTGGIRNVAFSPDGEFLAVAGDRFQVGLWEIGRPGNAPRFPIQHTAAFRDVAYASDGRLFGCGRDGTVHSWDQKTVRVLHSGDTEWMSVHVSSDGRLVAVGGRDKPGGRGGLVRVLDAATGAVLAEPAGRESVVWAVRFSPDGKRLFAGGESQIHVWDVSGLGQPPK